VFSKGTVGRMNVPETCQCKQVIRIQLQHAPLRFRCFRLPAGILQDACAVVVALYVAQIDVQSTVDKLQSHIELYKQNKDKA